MALARQAEAGDLAEFGLPWKVGSLRFGTVGDTTWKLFFCLVLFFLRGGWVDVVSLESQLQETALHFFRMPAAGLVILV